MEYYQKINFSITLPKELEELIMSFGKKIASMDGLVYEISSGTHCPHLTLYSSIFSVSEIDKVKNALKDIALETIPVSLKIKYFDGKRGYVGLYLEPTDEIYNLHKKIVETIAPFRSTEAPFSKDSPTEEDKILLDLYGSRNVLHNFTPHISLGKFENTDLAQVVIDFLNKESFEGFYTGTSLQMLDPGENCCVVLYETSLGL